jgi:hypothetical protein
MPRFQANFSYYPTVVFAPANIEFNNLSSIGTPIDDNNTVPIDVHGNILSITGALSSYSVSRIERYEWDFGDKLLSVDKTPKHLFDLAGVYPVKLSIVSEEFFDISTGLNFRIRNTIVQNVDVGSMSYAWLQQHMTAPHLQALEESQGFTDLIYSTSKMFDRMYAEIKSVADLMDVKRVAPKFLEFFSETLNHEKFYAEKIGYADQEQNDFYEKFLDYDIFERINKGIAGENEIEKFRQFLIHTATIFKQKGSRESMENFFKLYNFTIKIRDLWTPNFGLTAQPEIVEDFLLDPTLEKTQSKLKYRGISVTGFDNSLLNVVNNFNNITVDNYHFISRHSYPSDVLTESTGSTATSSTSSSPTSSNSPSSSPTSSSPTSSAEDCLTVFPIHAFVPYVTAINREDGRQILDKLTCSGFTPTLNCSGLEEGTCTENNIKIQPNTNWSGADFVVAGINYKFWNAPTDYVTSVINTVGSIPEGVDEIAELPTDGGNTSDDYLWADWNDGVTIPPSIVGLSENALTRPSWVTNLPVVNYETTVTNNNLISVENIPIPTTNDFFVVARGFIKIPRSAYYAFTLETGNAGTGEPDQHVALFSLKHNTLYTKEMINSLPSLDGITFSRDNTDVINTVGASGEISIYSKAGEYGIIEIRQNEISERSGDYYLEPGYYAFEVKATYSSLVSKKLKLYWESYTVRTQEDGTFFDTIQSFKVIPFTYFYTRKSTEAGNIDDELGKGLLSIPSTLIEGGDNFIVSYSQSNDSNDNISGIVSTAEKFKNLELNLRFSPELIPPTQENHNRTTQQKTISIIFRATNRLKDLYADYDTYYSVILNGKTGEIGVSQVGYSSEIDGAYYRYLNLNPDPTDLDKKSVQQLVVDEEDRIIKLEEGNYYDLKVVVVDNTVSVYFRNNVQFANAINNVRKTVQQDLANYADTDEYITVIKDLKLDQSDLQTEIMDAGFNRLDIAEIYKPILEEGAYGFSVKSSAFKIEEFKIVPLDKVDNKKFETQDKWQQIKPKYLDSRNNNLLQYNSYGVYGVDKPISPTFAVKVSNEYTGLENVFPIPDSIGPIDDNSVNTLYADNVTATEWGTRFNILLDKEFITNRFKTVEDIMDGLAVPYGNFYEPFINWSRSETSYSNTWQAGFTPFVSEKAQILPHTIAVSADMVLYPSEMVRSDTTSIKLVGPLADLLNATSHSVFGGLWEEICPNSIYVNWTVNDNTFANKVLEPIYRDNSTSDEVIGVRILDQKVMEKLICRYCENEVVWGLYEITLPEESVELHPFASTVEQTTVRYFIPIGKLNKDFYTFLPPADILDGYGTTVNLIGVFAHHSFEGFTFTDKVTVQIDELNPWEKDYKSTIQCRYFLDLQTSFIDKFTKYSKTSLAPNIGTPCSPGDQLEDADLTECDLPNAFYLPDNISKLLLYLEGSSSYFEADYNWWVPKSMWIKRKISVVYPNNSETEVYTGLNTPNPFFTSTDNITGEQGVRLVLQDGFDADNGKFVLDATWCVNSVGWDAEFATSANNSYSVGTFDTSAYNLIGFGEDSEFTLGTESLIPIGNFLNAPIPLSTVSVSGQTSLLFGDYLKDETGSARTFSPVGLFNWFTTHANEIDTPSSDVRAGWDISEWNNAFIEGFKFNAVYGEIDSSVFKVNKYWSFYEEYTPPFAAVVKIDIDGGNCEETDGENAPLNEVKTLTLGVSNGNNPFYSIPPIVEYYPKWKTNVSRVLVDHHSIDIDQFHVRVNTATEKPELVINNQLFDFSKYIGPTKFVIDFFNDKTFKLQQSIILKDNFDSTRQINWITFLENEGIYTIAQRLPETELKFTANKLPYEIARYKNTPVYKLLNKFEYENPSKFSGTASSNNEVGLFGNHGSINSLMLTDVESNNFSISCDVIFDRTITDTDFTKQFELILKAENNFIRDIEEWGVSDFYFVGIGAFNFDIGLGMRSVDNKTGEVKETFLASFGDFNIRNIKADVWYTLKAMVTSTEIKIIFHEKNTPERLVLNYNINKRYEKLTERYLKGEFENLQAIVTGLKELGITYPEKLGDSVSKEYTLENFKEEFAGTLPVNGYYSGFRTFNALTYVSNIEYIANIPKQYKFGSAFDGTSLNDMLYRIKNRFALPPDPDIKKVSQALNFTVYMQINDILFYQYQDSEPEKYAHQIENFEIVDDKIIIVEKVAPSDSAVGLNDWAVGEHEFVWSLKTNTQNVETLYDFFASVPNLTAAELTRDATTYIANLNITNDVVGSDIDVQVGDEIKLIIGGNRNVIWPLDGQLDRYNLNVRMFQEGFVQEYPILIKDKTFYKDGLKSYMDFADKIIKEVHINDNRLHILFKDN